MGLLVLIHTLIRGACGSKRLQGRPTFPTKAGGAKGFHPSNLFESGYVWKWSIAMEWQLNFEYEDKLWDFGVPYFQTMHSWCLLEKVIKRSTVKQSMCFPPWSKQWENNTSSSSANPSIAGWWLTYPSEKYEFVSWDDDIPNIWNNMTCSKPPTRMSCFVVFCSVAIMRVNHSVLHCSIEDNDPILHTNRPCVRVGFESIFNPWI